MSLNAFIVYKMNQLFAILQKNYFSSPDTPNCLIYVDSCHSYIFLVFPNNFLKSKVFFRAFLNTFFSSLLFFCFFCLSFFFGIFYFAFIYFQWFICLLWFFIRVIFCSLFCFLSRFHSLFLHEKFSSNILCLFFLNISRHDFDLLLLVIFFFHSLIPFYLFFLILSICIFLSFIPSINVFLILSIYTFL